MIQGTGPGIRRTLIGVIGLALAVTAAGQVAAGDRALTFRDLMALRQIQGPVISENGAWIAYQLEPDRGDGEAVVRRVEDGAEFRLPRAGRPVISADGSRVAAPRLPTQRERDEAQKSKGKDKPHRGLTVLSTAGGEIESIDDVESFALSRDGRWLAYQHYKVDDDSTEAPVDTVEAEEPEEPEEVGEPKETEEADAPEEHLGVTLILRDLATGAREEIFHVTGFVFDEPSRHLTYAVAEPGGEDNGLFVRPLGESPAEGTALHRAGRGRYTHPTWAKDRSRLAFLAAVDDEEMEPGPAELWIWEPGRDPRRAADAGDAPEGWTLPIKNSLTWSHDGDRLFFGFKPEDPPDSLDGAGTDGDGAENGADDDSAAESASGETGAADSTAADEPYDPYDIDALLADREVDVWHWDDPLIVPHQKKRWEKEKDRTYRAVYHRKSKKVVTLADPDLPEIRTSQNPRWILGFSDVPYRKEITWEGRFRDLHLVSLADGERTSVTRRLPEWGAVSLSPLGNHVVWYEAGHWHLFDAKRGETRNLTADLPVSFADEDHDYPSPAPGYGVAGWIEDDRAVLITDKYDLWRFPIGGGDPVNLTAGEGRKHRRGFRVVDLDPHREEIGDRDPLLLRSFHEPTKEGGFYRVNARTPGVRPLVEGENRYVFRAKAKDADRILYTRESYTEFPDLWVADPDLSGARKLSDANPEIANFAWGEAELIEWTSEDGTTHHGALIKPGNHEPHRRYPVVIYAYRLSSHRLHWFNQPVVNHRPSFPVYASHGYAVLLPDIRFEIGHPGRSATRALVAAVEELVEMGLADPDAVGLHGHSWGGYEAAQVITQTDVFKAVVAGAPVSNMTSAYSGIRLGSGLARQFQYERGQSRIGASLEEGLPLYIENSPVFHASRINTPLLIQTGDEDGAVPWQQSVELYLAMRRLGKECHLLQYRGEPHHLKKYPNKLDYSIKMKQFFDHHLKGEPAPAWMTEGVPYRGD